MFRLILCAVAMLGLGVGCNSNSDQKTKEATITNMDAKKGTVTVKMTGKGADAEKTFRLAENIEYADSTGKVANEEIFTSGDLVLIVESEGKISKMKKKEKTDTTKKSNSTDKTDKEAKIANETFIRDADQIDLAEIKIGKIAEEHASSEAVKKFGERMVRDHTSMNKELRDITSKKKMDLTEALDQKHQELASELSKLTGAKFDMAYTKDMVAGHEKAIEQFENEAKNGQDSDVKAWAKKWLPTLQEHLKLAQEAVKDVKGK